MSIPTEFRGVTAVAKANVYFDGKVVSHTVWEKNGEKKTVGLIYPGAFNFGTGKPELMQIVAGKCSVKLKGEDAWKSYSAGQEFRVAGDSSFDIKVDDGICEYLCIFI